MASTFAGKKVRCPKCQRIADIPAAAPRPEPEPAPEPLNVEIVEETAVQATPAAPVPAIPGDVKDAKPVSNSSSGKATPPKLPAEPEAKAKETRQRRPARPQSKSSILVFVLMLAGMGVVVVGGCAGIAVLGWLMFGAASPHADKQAADAKQQNPAIPEPPRLRLPPTPAPLPIRSDVVKEAATVDLPEAVHTVTVAGGGRMLLLHFQTMRKLGIFDANEAKIVGYLTLDEDNVRIAGGMNKLVLYYPGRGALERYDLLTRERELETKLSVTGKMLSFCMGLASDGPVLLSSEKSFHLIDLDKLTPLDLPPQGGERPANLAGNYYWAGGPGRVFGTTRADGGAPSGIATLSLDRDRLTYRYEHDGGWFIVPGPDGKNIFVGGHGIKRVDLAPSPDGEGFPNSRGNISTCYLPAHNGPFFLQLHVGFRTGGEAQPGDPKVGVTIYLLGSRKPLAQLGNVGLVPYDNYKALANLTYVGSVHLMPASNLLVVIPEGRDRLLLHPVDLDQALAQSGIPYLFVSSTPPSRVVPGTRYQYQIQTKAKAGGVTYKLETGPAGMTVTPQGLVQWTPANDFAQSEVSANVRVRAGDGRQILHTFVLTNAKAQ